MTARDDILYNLRATLARPDLRFPPAQTQPLTPATRLSVTQAEGSKLALAHRFGAELKKLQGSYQVVESVAEARMAVINQLLTWKSDEAQNRKGHRLETSQENNILSWHPESLPIVGVDDALKDMGFRLVVPTNLSSAESREGVRFIRYGLTGVAAAFATTASILAPSGPATSRAATQLPFRHIVLIPFAQLYPTLESWLRESRADNTLSDFLRAHATMALISGPSKSTAFEMNLTLGIHGPKFVHAILFGKFE